MKKTYPLTLLLLALLVFTLPTLAQNVEGNGKFATQTRQVAAFTGLKVTGGFEVVLTQGTTQSLKLEAEENVLPHIETEVRNGVLHIQTKDVKNAKKLKAYVTVRDLKSLELSGGIKLTSSNTIKSITLALAFSGGIKAELDLDVQELTGEIAGGTTTVLTGKANKVRMDLAGALSLKASELKTNYFTLDAAGVSNAEVNVSKELMVDAAGIVNVAYLGSPTVKHTGMGKVRPL